MNEPANQNRTHLYRIRRKADGLFLVSIVYGIPHGFEPGTFGPNGVFWWKEETIRKHLLELCQFRLYCGSGEIYDMNKRSSRGKRQRQRDAINPEWVIYPWDTPIHHVKTVFERLDLYEVIATEVSVHGSKTMEARAFASFVGDSDPEGARVNSPCV